LLFSPATQTYCSEKKMDWNSSMRSYRLLVALVAVPVVLWSLPLFRLTESHLSL
jgi:hypothetical protein